MPTLSMFFGISIQMHHNEHNPPHVHAKYDKHRAKFDFEGNVTDGSLPPKKEILVKAWIVLHKEELEACWEMIGSGETIPSLSIDPLK